MFYVAFLGRFVLPAAAAILSLLENTKTVRDFIFLLVWLVYQTSSEYVKTLEIVSQTGVDVISIGIV